MGDTTLRELVYGKGAHVDPVACVEDISAELAARTVADYPHSIWQIVEHMNYWMDYDLSKIAGENRPYPDKAVEGWPTHPNPATEGRAATEAWRTTTRRFHNSYHAGQIALLRRQFGAWPPERGGDTW